MIKVVVFGGGKGQSALLRGLKLIPELDISAIVTVADDGGSTGRLREEFKMPAMGDIRNVMVALAESESLISNIMNYRFDSDAKSDLAGHSIGNIILTGLTNINGNFMDAIMDLSSVMKVHGKIIPSSMELITLCARMQDGTIVRGESNIPMYDNNIEKVFYDVDVKATSQAIDAIQEADIILFGIGSLYTSILPNIIIPEIKEALHKSSAKKVYYCNSMTQPGETDGYNGEAHVEALEKHLELPIDLVIDSDTYLSNEILEKYASEKSYPVHFRKEDKPYKLITQDLLSVTNEHVRHDPTKIKEQFMQVLEAVDVVYK